MPVLTPSTEMFKMPEPSIKSDVGRYLTLKGKGDTRQVFHPNGTMVGTINKVGKYWYGKHANGDPVLFAPKRGGKLQPRYEATTKHWTNNLYWGISLDDLLKDD